MAAPKLHITDDDRLLPDPVPEEEARASFDRAAQRILGISGDEFLRRWDAGEFDGLSEDDFGRKVIALWMLLPLVRPLDPETDGRLLGGD